MDKVKLEKMWKYVIYTYLLFWVMVLGLGGLASIVFHASAELMRWVTVLCSWAPTFVLWLMMKEIIPHSSIKTFYKGAFKDSVHWNLILMIPIIIGGIFLISSGLLAAFEKVNLRDQMQFIPSLLISNILFTALQGPSGEESGWRGYLRPEMERKYGFLKGNVILGLVWAFWHMPLWFVSSEYSGWQLFIYIVSVVIVLTALKVMMGVWMKRCNNLFIAFWAHFCFNFTLTFFAGDVYFFVIFASLYILISIAIYFCFYSKKQPA